MTEQTYRVLVYDKKGMLCWENYEVYLESINKMIEHLGEDQLTAEGID